MDLKLNNLTLPKERVYFFFVLFFSLIAWAFLAVTVVGLIYALVLAFLLWLSNGLFVAYLRSESVLINEDQLPTLFKTYHEVCGKLELNQTPELFILQSGGLLNAFATRHSRRKFIVISSDALEAFGQDTDEIRFLIGHEIGHIKRKHLTKQLFLFPGMVLPLLGPAYQRACEATCDRYGAFATNNVDGAMRAMMVFSGGRDSGKWMNADVFSDQYKKQRGFFVSWHELISGYPTLSQRVANLKAIKNGEPAPKSGRNPLAYLFAFFTFGGSGAGGNLLITVAIVALLAAIAIPNLLRARISANDALARATLNSLSTAAETYAANNEGKYPGQMIFLTNTTSPYIKEDYCSKTISGFYYKCQLSEGGYMFVATPVDAGTTGTGTYTITTGGIRSFDE